MNSNNNLVHMSKSILKMQENGYLGDMGVNTFSLARK